MLLRPTAHSSYLTCKVAINTSLFFTPVRFLSSSVPSAKYGGVSAALPGPEFTHHSACIWCNCVRQWSLSINRRPYQTLSVGKWVLTLGEGSLGCVPWGALQVRALHRGCPAFTRPPSRRPGFIRPQGSQNLSTGRSWYFCSPASQTSLRGTALLELHTSLSHQGGHWLSVVSGPHPSASTSSGHLGKFSDPCV